MDPLQKPLSLSVVLLCVNGRWRPNASDLRDCLIKEKQRKFLVGTSTSSRPIRVCLHAAVDVSTS